PGTLHGQLHLPPRNERGAAAPGGDSQSRCGHAGRVQAQLDPQHEAVPHAPAPGGVLVRRAGPQSYAALLQRVAGTSPGA
ncbi:unnamed protein product, partial [Amoebophrya sp. A120]